MIFIQRVCIIAMDIQWLSFREEITMLHVHPNKIPYHCVGEVIVMVATKK